MHSVSGDAVIMGCVSTCRLLPKQLDSKWIASRSLKPRLSALWRPQDWQPEVANTGPAQLTRQPTAQQIAAQLLRLPPVL